MPNSSVEAFRDAFRTSQHIIVIAGAGLSAASGIPTFRDGGGMWRSLDATALATPEAFSENPSLVWQFYHYRRTKALEAKPNPAHEVIAKMSVPLYIRKVAPEVKSFHLVTQNVDRLSVTALDSLVERLTADSGTAPARKRSIFPNSILEMHGRIFDVKCTVCDYCAEDRTDPLCPALGAADASFKDYHDAGSKEVNIPLDELPRCPACGALARPGVVWFGEKPYHLDEINSIIYKADMCLVIGTSSTVRPASTYAYRVQRHGGKVAVFNKDPSEKDERADFVFAGGCETVLPSLFPELVE
ncbi:DHS-like NAD/FAD-binding domain-containing protein [Gloeophyllum trabeum ATCC 11539]|uniref:NAD-dependent protein deacylase n=1 Tax=Gloeophyllum trabeum (strain ATCC 11539 / FP-39264 / Madison 617) TaxID=670483 RepID=S7Q8I7_GLOTA|nr:DHS-like NAD/FAD-binding domain-containing protein [Gloeophyllum trabeum ATCC 11539]EPQ55758.1 DHS-like NAD/FAD-binding domain-containing protein [Gloeophyllum trabeum ATCC 11539]